MDNQAEVVRVNEGTADIRTISGLQLNNVNVAAPLSADKLKVGDVVALLWISGTPHITSILGHKGQRQDKYVDTEPPPPPANLQVVSGGSKLTWEFGGTISQRSDLSHYEVDAKRPGGAWGYDVYPVSEGKTEHFARLNVSVRCRVRAVDLRGNVSAWEPADDLLGDTVAPGTPTGMAYKSLSLTTILLSWTASPEPDLDHYCLEVSTSAGGAAVILESVSSNNYTTTWSYAVTAYWRINAADKVGNTSDWTAWQQAETLQPVPPELLNGDLEEGTGSPDDWTLNSAAPITTTWSTAEAYSPTHSVKIAVAADTGADEYYTALISDYVAVQQNIVYKLNGFTYTSAATSNVFRLTVYQYRDATGTAADNPSRTFTLTQNTTWDYGRPSYTFMILPDDDDVAYVRVAVEVHLQTTYAQSLYVDSFFMELYEIYQPSEGDLVYHSDLLGVTSDQHHNQAHALSGSDHTGELIFDQLDGLTAAPSFTFSISSGVGAGSNLVRADAQIALYENVNPNDVTLSAYYGGASKAARRDHQHAISESIEPTWTGEHQFDADIQLNANLDIIGARTITGTTSFQLYPAGSLYLGGTGHVIFNPEGGVARPQYTLQTDLGTVSKQYGSVWAAELRVANLVAENVIATVNGRIIVRDSTYLVEDLAIEDPSDYICVEHNNLSRQDFLFMEARGVFESMQVDSVAITDVDTTNDEFEVAGDWTAYFTDTTKFTVAESTGNNAEWTCDGDATYATGYTTIAVAEDITDGTVDGYIYYTGEQTVGPFFYLNIDRGLDGSPHAWYAGETVLDTGYQYDGYIDLYSQNGILVGDTGPTIVGVVRATTAWDGLIEHWAIGNLDGLYDYTGDNKYGAAFGQYAASNVWVSVDEDEGWRINIGTTPTTIGQWDTDGNITVGQVTERHILITASGGLQIKNGSSTVLGEWDSSGNITVGQTSQRHVLITAGGSLKIKDGSSVAIELDSSGDAIFGDAAAGDANMFYDESTGRLNFRQGTDSAQAYIDATTGAIMAADGAIRLDNEALTFQVDGTMANAGVIYFKDGATEKGFIYDDGSSLILASASFHVWTGPSHDTWALIISAGQITTIAALEVGSTAQGAGNAEIWSDGDARIGGGLSVGSSKIDPGTDNIVYEGILRSVKTSTHSVYAFHPLSTPRTVTGFEGDSFSDVTTSTIINYDDWSTAIPTEAKALLIQIVARDSGAGNNWFSVGPSSSYYYAAAAKPVHGSDYEAEQTAPVPCTNGNIYYRCNASGTDTLDVWLRCWGYWI